MKKELLRLGILLCLAAGLGSARPARAGCGTASCPLDLGSHLQERLRLQAAFEHIVQDQPVLGSREVPFDRVRRPDHDEIETLNRNLQVRADYALSKHFALSLSLPLVHRSHQHLENPEHRHGGEHDHGKAAQEPDSHADDDLERARRHWEFTRWGDLALRGRYAPVPALSLSLGLSLPTGPTDMRDREGHLAEPSLQPGRGAFGLLLELAAERHLPVRGQKARLFASTSYRRSGPGERDYRSGDEWHLHAGGHYPLAGRLDLLGQLSALWQGRDQPGRSGELTDATGGTHLFLSPGLRLDLDEALSLYGYVQVPLYRNLNAVQLASDRNLLIGLDYQFDLHL